MPTRTTQLETIEKRIYFYRIYSKTRASGQIVELDISTILAQLEELPFDENGRYQVGADDENYCTWIHNYRRHPCITFGTIRRSGLPQMERAGRLLNLPMQNNAGLAEVTQIAFFPNNIFGAVFNFYGPRPTRLASYLSEKINTLGNIIVEPLINQDALAQINALSQIYLFDLKIKTSFLTSMEQADESLGAGLRAIIERSNAKTVRIIIKSGRSRGEHLSSPLKDTIRRLLRLENLHEETDKFVVSGINDTTRERAIFDLLNDKFVSTKAIVRQGVRTRALDTNAAFDAIILSYGELHQHLQRAAGVRL